VAGGESEAAVHPWCDAAVHLCWLVVGLARKEVVRPEAGGATRRQHSARRSNLLEATACALKERDKKKRRES
jgi:hypothetical protein